MRRVSLLALSALLPACAPSEGGGSDPIILQDAVPEADATPPADAGPEGDGSAQPDGAPGSDQGTPDEGPEPDLGAASDQGTAPDQGAEPDLGPAPDAAACPPGTRAPDCAEIDECAQGNPCGDSPLVTCVDLPGGAAPRCVCDARDDRAALLAGVPALDFAGALPSALVAHGPGTFTVVADAQHRPVVAAARHGAGRVVHIAHEGVTTRAPGDGTGFGELTEATLGWLGGEAPVVGVGPGFDGLRNALAGRGYAVRPVVGPADLDGLDVFATTAYVEYDAAMRAAVEAFVAGGGALLSAGHAWWWAQGGGDVVNDFPGNRMLRPFGLTVLGETAAGGAYGVERFVDSELGQARCGLWALADEARGVAELAPAERTLAAAAAGGAVSVLPMDSPLFQAAVEISAQVGPVVPTPADPVVPAEQPLRALAVRVQVRQALDAPAEQVQAHPAGDDFPGAVDPDAPRVAFEINHLLRYAGYPAGYVAASAGAHLWLPTVMYAAPGEVISVRVPERVAGQGLAIQIGAHTDTLWHRDRWERMPAVTRRVPLSQPITSIATGFGGPVYLTVPPGTDLGEAVILFQGGVHMPLYQFPQDPAAFQAEVAATGAPWVDVMANQRVNLLLPTSVARDIVDPQALMAFWTDAMDTISGLDGVDPARERTERFVFDRQISAGWMHSGYPIMAHLPSALEVSDLDALTTVGAWGPFHELGHNHQWVDWLLPGTGEASCNLWSVIASEAVAGVPRAAAHPELTPARRAQRLQAWRTNPDPARWEVWTALETYLQLQEAFGWDWLTRTFQAYRALPEGQRPRDDAARRQLWIRQTSRAIGRDLTDFYRAWAFPVTPETAAAVADLPAWADHPMR